MTMFTTTQDSDVLADELESSSHTHQVNTHTAGLLCRDVPVIRFRIWPKYCLSPDSTYLFNGAKKLYYFPKVNKNKTQTKRN